ncbi:hypothetical protein [Archangium sp.]|uniref:hypothetical protein n=1 Tax=Archangium sp. TaxID=1872627 RepID=UPI00286CE41C|nr:hypothetical protein [Archangium sp.]
MRLLIRALRLFAKIWIALVLVLVALGAFAILARHGWARFQEVFNPFNFWNTGVLILALSPAIVAESWAGRLEERLPLSLEAAEKLVREYGAALERRTALPLSTNVALPASKERIKEALRVVAARAVQDHDKDRLGLIGASYLLLSEFHPMTATWDSIRAEHEALAAEWFSWKQQLRSPLGDPSDALQGS